MKKIITILLSAIMLFSLAACQEVQDPKKAENGVPVEYATPGTIGTEFEGVNIEVVGIEVVDGKTTLKTKWVNDTSHRVVYGNSYNISRSENGEWMGCEVRDNLAFEEIAYELKANTANSKTYNLTGYYDISAPGTYRITSNFRIYENGADGDGAPYSLWAEFTVLDPEETNNDDGRVELEFEAQYIRTNGEHNGVEHVVVRSADELQAYYEQNKDKHNLERRENPLSDQTIGFLDACDAYDEEFFEENALIMVLLEEGSGSIRHKVKRVTVPDPVMSTLGIKVEIDSIVPEACTDDMAGWHILISVNKEDAGTHLNCIRIYYDGRLANAIADVEQFTIVDIAARDNIPCDQAFEEFFRDDTYIYEFSCIKSDLVEVQYLDGRTENIKTALENGNVKINDLGRFGIKYYRKTLDGKEVEEDYQYNKPNMPELNADEIDAVTIKKCFPAVGEISGKDIGNTDTIAKLVEILSGEWIEGTADCLNDYSISIGGEDFTYHSDCGTFNDASRGRSLVLDGETKAYVNSVFEIQN